MIENINDENFLIFAIKAYSSANYSMMEFEEDISRIKYIKRLIRKYRQSGNLKERLILNHIITLSNVFGVEATTKMLFFKMEKDDYGILKAFLLFLNFMPKTIEGIGGKQVKSADIVIDLNVVKRLKDI